MSKINKIKLSGQTYDIEDSYAAKTVSLTQKQYDALVSGGTVDPNTLYVITDAEGVDLSDYWTSAVTESAITYATSGKAENSDFVAHSGDTSIHVTSSDKQNWNSKQAALTAGSGITIDAYNKISLAVPITSGSGNNSIVEGIGTSASGTAAHVEGGYSKANGLYSHAEGSETKANGLYSHSEGNNTIANNEAEHASGNYNVSSSASTTFGDSGNTLFSVGNGTSTSARHNAFEIRQNGDIYITSGGTDIKLQDNLGGGGGGGITSGEVQTMIDEATSGYTARFAEDEEVTAAGLNALNETLSGKQDTLSAGTGIEISGNVISATGGGSASSAITSGDTNPVQGGVLFDELRIPITSEVETLLEWVNHDEGETTNYPLGCSKIKIYVDEPQFESVNGYQFWETDWESVGEINIDYNNGNVTVISYSNVTYTIDGNVVTVNYPSIAADVTKIHSTYDNYWTVKAYTSGGIVYEPLIDQVSANTISIQGKQDTLSAGTGIEISGNVISATGGGKAISAGTNISVATGETADTINCTLPLTITGNDNTSLIRTNQGGTVSQKRSFAYGTNLTISPYDYSNSAAFGDGNTTKGQASFICGKGNTISTLAGFTFACGENNTIGYYCAGGHIEGGYNNIDGGAKYAHSEGYFTRASQSYSHTEGLHTNAKNQSEHSSGQYNVSSSATTTFGNSGNTLFSVGNGTADNARHNAFEIRQNGDIYLTKDGVDIKLQDNLGGGAASSAITSGDTNAVAGGAVYDKFNEVEQVTAAGLNALNDAFGGLKLMKISQTDYDNLQVKDQNTLYIIS